MFGKRKLKREIKALKEYIKVLEFINRNNLYELKYEERYSGDWVTMSMDYYTEISFLNRDKTKIITKRFVNDPLTHYKIEGIYVKEYHRNKVVATYMIVNDELVEVK